MNIAGTTDAWRMGAIIVLLLLLVGPALSYAGDEGGGGEGEGDRVPGMTGIDLPGEAGPSDGTGTDDGAGSGGGDGAAHGAGTRSNADLRIRQWNYPTEGEVIALRLQTLNVTVENLDFAVSTTATMSCSIRNSTSGALESVSGGGNINLGPREVRTYEFTWTPSTIGFFDMEATVTNIDDDPDLTNNPKTIQVEVKRYKDLAVQMISPANNTYVPYIPTPLTARVTNLGSYPLDQDVTLDITGVNASWEHTPDFYTDSKLITQAQLSSPNDYVEVTFDTTFDPPYQGLFQFNLSFNYPPDRVPNNIEPVAIVMFTDDIAPGVFVEAPTEKYGEPGGGLVTHTFKVYNTGSIPDKYSWTAVSGHDWIVAPAIPTGTTGVIQPKNYGEVPIAVQVPPGTPAATTDKLRLNVTSTNYPFVVHSNFTYTNTLIKRAVNVTAPPDKPLFPGDTENLSFYVRNEGNIPESFYVEALLGDPDSGWELEIKTPPLGWTKALDPQETAWVKVQVTVPEFNWEKREAQRTCVDSMPMDITVRATAENGPSGSATANIVMRPILTASLEPDPKEMVIPFADSATAYAFNVTVKNIGNYVELPASEGWAFFNLTTPNVTFVTHLGNTNDSDRWDSGVGVDIINLTFGAEEVVRLTVLAPAYPFNGTAIAPLRAEPMGGSILPGKNITTRTKVYLHAQQSAGVEIKYVEDKDKKPVDVDGDGSGDWPLAIPGKPLHLTFNVSNHGNGLDVYNISVELSDGRWNYTIKLDGNLTDSLVPRGLNKSDPAHYQLFNVTIFVPQRTLMGTRCDVTVTARSVFNTTVNASDTVTVKTGRGYGVDLEPEENSTIIQPGGSHSFMVSVTNIGNGPDAIGIAWGFGGTQPGWSVELGWTEVSLEAWETAMLNVTVHAAPGTTADHMMRINITGMSLADTTAKDRVNISVAAGEVLNISFTPMYAAEPAGQPGDYLNFDILARNDGNVNATVNFDINSLYSGWKVRVRNNTHAALAPGEYRVLGLNVSIPSLVDRPTTEWLLESGILSGSINNLTINATVQTSREEAGRAGIPVHVLPLMRSTAFFTDPEEDVPPLIPCVTGGTLVRDLTYLGTNGTRTNGDEITLIGSIDGGTIPGRSVEYPVTVINTGNGPDTVQLDVNGTARHRSWASVQDTVFSLEVAEMAHTSLSVTPAVHTRPFWHEVAEVMVEPRSTLGDTGISAAAYTTVGSLYVEEDQVQVLLGDMVEARFILMNVPLQGDNASEGQILPETYNILAGFSRGTTGSEGWMMLDPGNSTESIEEAYDERELSMRFRATLSSSPAELVANLDISATSAIVPTKSDTVGVEALAYFTDFSIDIDNIQMPNPVEGEEVKVRVLVEASTNVVDLHVWARVFIEDKQVLQELLTLNYTYAEYYLEADYTARDLHWAQKQAEVTLTVELDREDRVMESRPGDGPVEGEENNLKEVTVLVRDAGIRGEVGFFFIFWALVGVLVVFWYITETYELYILLNVCLAIVGGFLFTLPWYALVETTQGVNSLGWGILSITMLLMAVVTFFAARDCARAYIVHRMGEKAKGIFGDEEAERKDSKRELQGEGARKSTFWKGGGDAGGEFPGDERDEDLSRVEYGTVFVPTLISLLTAAVGFPLMIACIAASTFAVNGDGSVFGGSMLSYFGPSVGSWHTPNLLYMLYFILIALVVFGSLLWVQISVWGKLHSAENILREIRADMERHINEEEEPDRPEDEGDGRERDGGRGFRWGAAGPGREQDDHRPPGRRARPERPPTRPDRSDRRDRHDDRRDRYDDDRDDRYDGRRDRYDDRRGRYDERGDYGDRGRGGRPAGRRDRHDDRGGRYDDRGRYERRPGRGSGDRYDRDRGGYRGRR